MSILGPFEICIHHVSLRHNPCHQFHYQSDLAGVRRIGVRGGKGRHPVHRPQRTCLTPDNSGAQGAHGGRGLRFEALRASKPEAAARPLDRTIVLKVIQRARSKRKGFSSGAATRHVGLPLRF